MKIIMIYPATTMKTIMKYPWENYENHNEISSDDYEISRGK